MRKLIISSVNWLSLIIISLSLIGNVVSLVKDQSTWNIVYVVILGVAWLSFLLLFLVKPKKVAEE